MVKNLPAMQETWFNPWVRKIPWRSEWLPTPVFLPGESHEQRSLTGYHPWGHKESDKTEQLSMLLLVCCYGNPPIGVSFLWVPKIIVKWMMLV